MEAYKVDNKTSILGPFVLFATIIIGGLLIGVSIYLIRKIIYLVCLFPMIFGAVAGFMLMKAVQIGKVRIPILAGLCGIAMAIVLYGSFHYIDYLATRNAAYLEFVDELKPKYGSDSGRIANLAIDEGLIEKTGFPGFIGYMIFKDQHGVQIGQVFSSSSNKSDHLNPVLTWLYWLMELLVITVTTSLIAVNATSKPFCQTHDRWYPKREKMGGVPMDQAKELYLLLQGGKFSDAGHMLQQGVRSPNMDLYLQSCENCSESPTILQLETNIYDKSRGRMQTNKILNATISPLLAAQLIQGTRKSAFENQTGTTNAG